MPMFDDNSVIRQFSSNIKQAKKIQKKNSCLTNLYYLWLIIFNIGSLVLFLGGFITTVIFFSRETSQNIDYWKDKDSNILFFPWIILLICVVIYIGNLVFAVRIERNTPRDNIQPLFVFWYIILSNLIFLLGNVIITESDGFMNLWYYPSVVISALAMIFAWKKYQDKHRQKRAQQITNTIQVKHKVGRQYRVSTAMAPPDTKIRNLYDIPL